MMSSYYLSYAMSRVPAVERTDFRDIARSATYTIAANYYVNVR